VFEVGWQVLGRGDWAGRVSRGENSRLRDDVRGVKPALAVVRRSRSLGLLVQGRVVLSGAWGGVDG